MRKTEKPKGKKQARKLPRLKGHVRRVPTPETIQQLVSEFMAGLKSKKRPPLIGCLVVLAWQRQHQIHSQSVLLATEDAVGEIILATVQEHRDTVHTGELPTGHA